MRVKPDLTFSKLDEETGGQLDTMFNKKDCMVEINPGRVVLPADYMTIGEDILNMEVLDTDVWMCSYPRTGECYNSLFQHCNRLTFMGTCFCKLTVHFNGIFNYLFVRGPVILLDS